MPKDFRARLQVTDGKEGEDFYKVRHVPSIILFDGKSLICIFLFSFLHIQTHQQIIPCHVNYFFHIFILMHYENQNKVDILLIFVTPIN